MALSTDIGSIEVQGPVTGPVRTDTRIDGEGIGNALTGVINEGRVNKFEQALDDTAADVFETGDGNQGGRTAPLTGDPDADQLLTNIYAYEDGIAQSSGSRRSALGLQLRQVYDQFATKYPRLRGQLATELSRFERTDPEIAALDLMASTDAASSALQAKDLERIKTTAYDELGMDPGTTRFGSIEFAREYARRNRAVQRKVVNDQILEAQASVQDLDIETHLNTFQEGMSGEASDTTETFMEFREDLATVQLALLDPTQPGATQTIQLFNNGRKQALEASILKNISMAQRRFNAIPITYSDRPKYMAAKSVLDSHVKMLSGLLEGLDTNNPALISAYQTYATAQEIAFEAENRDVVGMARQVGVFKDVLELGQDTFGGEGKIVKHELGTISIDLLEAMIGRDIALSTGLPGTARTPDALRLAYSAQSQGVQDITGQGATDQKTRQLNLVEAQIVANQSEYLKLASEGVLAPEKAGTFMSAQAARLVNLNQSGTLDWTAQKSALETWATPEILAMAKISAEANPAFAELAGEEMANIQHSYDVHRVNEYIDNLNQMTFKFGPATVQQHEFVKPVFDDIENGNVTFVVDKQAAIKRLHEIYPGGRTGATIGMIRKMEDNARELTRIVSKDLKWLAHIEALHNGTFEADYGTQYDLSFGNMQMPRETDGQSNTN